MYAKDEEKTEGVGLSEGFIRDNYRPVQLSNGRTVYKNFNEYANAANAENNVNDANVAKPYVSAMLLTAFLGYVTQFLL